MKKDEITLAPIVIDGNEYLLAGASFGVLVLFGGIVYLQIKIKKQIKSLKDIKK